MFRPLLSAQLTCRASVGFTGLQGPSKAASVRIGIVAASCPYRYLQVGAALEDLSMTNATSKELPERSSRPIGQKTSSAYAMILTCT